jgi:hypothetical protein
MDIAITNRRLTMLKKILLVTSTTAAALGFSGLALANPPHWAPAYGWRAHQYHSHYYAPRPVYVVPAPRVVYAPTPPVVYPYYAAPVVVRPAPVYRAAPVYPAAPGVSIRFSFPL